jgi:hypothetical protein
MRWSRLRARLGDPWMDPSTSDRRQWRRMVMRTLQSENASCVPGALDLRGGGLGLYGGARAPLPALARLSAMSSGVMATASYRMGPEHRGPTVTSTAKPWRKSQAHGRRPLVGAGVSTPATWSNKAPHRVATPIRRVESGPSSRGSDRCRCSPGGASLSRSSLSRSARR